jgi:hypothetical protein
MITYHNPTLFLSVPKALIHHQATCVTGPSGIGLVLATRTVLDGVTRAPFSGSWIKGDLCHDQVHLNIYIYYVLYILYNNIYIYYILYYTYYIYIYHWHPIGYCCSYWPSPCRSPGCHHFHALWEKALGYILLYIIYLYIYLSIYVWCYDFTFI